MKSRLIVLLITLSCGFSCVANTESCTDRLDSVAYQMATGANFVVTGPNSNSCIKAQNTNDNLISIRLDAVELSDVIRMFSRISGVNILASPANLHGRVTVNLTDVEWKPALESILDMVGLELVERTPGTEVYSVISRRNWNFESMSHLIFRAPGDISPTNAVTLNLTNSTLSHVLCEIARQGHINICYAPNADEKDNFTIAFTNADSHAVLVQITAMQQTGLTWSPRLNSYVVGAPLATYVPPSTTTTGSPNIQFEMKPSALIVIVCVVLLWILFWWLNWCHRKVSSDIPPSSRSSWLGIMSLSLLYGILLFEAVFGWMLSNEDYLLKLLAGGILLSLVLFTIAIRVRNACRARGWHPRGAKRLAVWCLVCLPLTVFFMDSRPLEGDYTWQDLPTPKQNATESYALLQKIYGPHPLELKVNLPNLSDPTVSSNILVYAAQIEQAWADSKELRDVVEHLAAFDEVADLSKQELTTTDFYIYSGWKASTCRILSNTYAAYINLKTQQGRTEEAASILGTYHTAIRRILPNARSAVARMTCVAAIDRNTSLAWKILEKSGNDQHIPVVLNKAFPAIQNADISIKTSLLVEYLEHKDLLQDMRGEDWLAIIYGFRGQFEYGIWIPPKPPSFFQGIVSRGMWIAAVRRNRTIDDLRQHCQVQMAQAAEIPPDFKASDKLMERISQTSPTHESWWMALPHCMFPIV